MEDFKNFLIRLQTFDFNVGKRNAKTSRPPYEVVKQPFYELAHENVHLNPLFESELIKLKELSATDMLGLQKAQITTQLKRLDQLKEKFSKLEDRYFTTYRGLEEHERRRFLFKLKLQEDFIVNNLHPGQYDILVSDQLLDDILDSLEAKRKHLLEFEKDILKVLSNEEVSVIDDKNLQTIPIFISPGIIEEVYAILHPYFHNDEKEKLKGILNNRDSGPVTFNGQGIQLADAFKHLYEANLIVGCTKSELQIWIRKNFDYIDKGIVKHFPEKYLGDIISSNSKICQSPILDAKRKEDGRLTVIPTMRRNKSK